MVYLIPGLTERTVGNQCWKLNDTLTVLVFTVASHAAVNAGPSITLQDFSAHNLASVNRC